jgi:hypothetical protein
MGLEVVFREFASILVDENDLAFAGGHTRLGFRG